MYRSTYTIIGVFALVGGFISTYYYIVVFAMSSYTRYCLESKLAANLYFFQTGKRTKPSQLAPTMKTDIGASPTNMKRIWK